MKAGHISACFLDYFVVINILFCPVVVIVCDETLYDSEGIDMTELRVSTSGIVSMYHKHAYSFRAL
jgi:hypothetical protein